nr:dephospho-CoA kinase [uncultured Desulfuromonas sp.]
MILGVTGGIASGKSTVVALLADLGAQVVSADQLSRDLVEPGQPALAALVTRFGETILNSDGTLDRKGLGKQVFADPDARRDLEAILHPAIAELSKQRLQQAGDLVGPSGLVVYEAPLLYEAGAEDRVDRVLTVTVAEEVQLQRLMARDQCDATAAQQRIDAQMPQEEKARRADYILDNSADLATLKTKVYQLFDQLCPGAAQL